VPNATRHDVGITGPKNDLRFRTYRPLVTVVEDQFHRSAHDVEELVAIWVDFATMRSWSVDIWDRSDCVSIDSPGRPRRGRGDGHGRVSTDIRNVSFEVDGRWVRGDGHPIRLPDSQQAGHWGGIERR
jgi:hypothetical protein